MTEEEKIFAGKLFCPGDDDLRALKFKSHNLCTEYNALYENDTEKRNRIIKEIFSEIGEGSFLQGPIYIHYGCHTKIGKKFFGNFNLTIQDDALVTIGDNCNFGPNVTIVTPLHPLIASERNSVIIEGESKRVCYAKPVTVGNDCWFGANVVVCPGVTIGDGVVIGAGSVVTKDIPSNVVAVGNPCRVLREITDKDSVLLKKELF